MYKAPFSLMVKKSKSMLVTFMDFMNIADLMYHIDL